MAYHRHTSWKQICLVFFSWACVDKSPSLLFEACTFLGEHHPWPVYHLVGALVRSLCETKPVMHKARMALGGGRSWVWVMLDVLMSPYICHSPAELRWQCYSEEMSGQEKENCGPVTSRMAWITGLAGDGVPGDPGDCHPQSALRIKTVFPWQPRAT